MLAKRLLFGLVMSLAVVGLIAADAYLTGADITRAAPGVMVMALVGSVLGGRELFDLVERGTYQPPVRPFRSLGLVLIVAAMGTAWWSAWSDQSRSDTSTSQGPHLLAGGLALGVASVFLAQGLRGHAQGATVNIAVTIMAVAYLGGLGSSFVLFALGTASVWNVLLLLTVIKSADIGAYITGRAVGRHKLMVWLSPGKTWEGTLGGLTLAGGVSVTFGATLGATVGWPAGGGALLFGLFVAGVGQLGDLAKSLIKRDVGVKDSGAAVPGFGGVLDIIDSPLMASPFAYMLWPYFT